MTLRPLIRDLVRGPLRSPLDRRGGFDPDAAAWAAAVTAAGGTYSATTLNAVSIFVRSAKAAGYWTKINRINLFCGNQLTAALVPLKAGGGSATETNVNFVAGDYTEATGLTGNGTTKYLRTGLIPSTALTANDTHMAIYNRSGGATSGAMIGSQNSATQKFTLSAPDQGFTSIVSDQYDQTVGQGRVASGAITAPFGFVIGSRTASNAHTAYQAGVSVATAATAGGTLPTVEMYVMARNDAGVANLFCAGIVVAYSAGSGLTAGDVTAYNTHMQAFQTALNRAV